MSRVAASPGFQFLIGRLVTSFRFQLGSERGVFQFLIGRLVT